MSDKIPKGADNMPREDNSGLFVKIPRKDFNIIMRQHLASKNLYAYLQDVACENKRLLQRNATLEKAILRTGKQISELVMTRGRHCEFTEFSSLPSCLQDHRLNQYCDVQKEVNKLMDTVKDQSDLSDRDKMPVLHVTDTQSVSLKSQVFFPPSMSIRADEEKSDELKTLTADDVVADGSEKMLSLQDTMSVNSGVSRQYFNIIVRELAKCKRFIQQLLIKNGEKPKDVMNVVHLKELVQSLEETNSRLRESNRQLEDLLESKSQDRTLMGLHEKVQKLERQLNLKEKTLKELNKQCDSLKASIQPDDSTCDSLKTSIQPDDSTCDSLKTSIQPDDSTCDSLKTSILSDDLTRESLKTSIRPDDSTCDSLKTSIQSDFSTLMAASSLHKTENSSSQTDVMKSSQHCVSVQTDDESTKSDDVCGEDGGLSKPTEVSDAVHHRIADLEILVADLTTAISERDARLTALHNENKMLERNYKQMLQSLVDIEQDHDALRWKEEKVALVRQLDQKSRYLKEQKDDAKYSLKKIQSLQHDVGKLNTQKCKLEATLKKEREDYKKRETQYLNQIQAIQAQFDHVLDEKNKMQTVSLSKLTMARPHLVSEPMSLGPPCRPMNVPWKQAYSEVSLVADGDPSLAPLVEEVVGKSAEDKTSKQEFVCKHCLRTDFSSLESFQHHLNRCGD
ncbi:RB1-inducible coiled-coil protein 1-like [Gigantopelta aegis]|uniref:RB1-inducible coiled-coil protein 1-like n=1 Tax=Gigantopelta aegis TaxID=1735272 RepID=UPI001B889CCC|nr:RB1-inducible coiled-coil protein 1-like [Gigantopelta aegis]XP_041365044.1 RB1-inducible coiled-coil protein 1-like [Gigantopelta aegis]